ncbi:hypothetical protein J6590_047754 [Homalodisca vitripennis]|nr:hypothetical protein J6590_047754 [Homalodisca vitripennis]
MSSLVTSLHSRLDSREYSYLLIGALPRQVLAKHATVSWMIDTLETLAIPIPWQESLNQKVKNKIFKLNEEENMGGVEVIVSDVEGIFHEPSEKEVYGDHKVCSEEWIGLRACVTPYSSRTFLFLALVSPLSRSAATLTCHGVDVWSLLSTPFFTRAHSERRHGTEKELTDLFSVTLSHYFPICLKWQQRLEFTSGPTPIRLPINGCLQPLVSSSNTAQRKYIEPERGEVAGQGRRRLDVAGHHTTLPAMCRRCFGPQEDLVLSIANWMEQNGVMDSFTRSSATAESATQVTIADPRRPSPDTRCGCYRPFLADETSPDVMVFSTQPVECRRAYRPAKVGSTVLVIRRCTPLPNYLALFDLPRRYPGP